MVPMHTVSKVKPGQVNIGLAVARASFWALNMVPELCILVLLLAPLKVEYFLQEKSCKNCIKNATLFLGHKKYFQYSQD
jgi:hypothetical protein